MVLQGVQGFRDDYLSHVESGRCLFGWDHPVPCVALCPAGVDIPGYIALVRAGRYNDAVRLIRKDNPFPTVCGYVCEHGEYIVSLGMSAQDIRQRVTVKL